MIVIERKYKYFRAGKCVPSGETLKSYLAVMEVRHIQRESPKVMTRVELCALPCRELWARLRTDLDANRVFRDQVVAFSKEHLEYFFGEFSEAILRNVYFRLRPKGGNVNFPWTFEDMRAEFFNIVISLDTNGGMQWRTPVTGYQAKKGSTLFNYLGICVFNHFAGRLAVLSGGKDKVKLLDYLDYEALSDDDDVNSRRPDDVEDEAGDLETVLGELVLRAYSGLEERDRKIIEVTVIDKKSKEKKGRRKGEDVYDVLLDEIVIGSDVAEAGDRDRADGAGNRTPSLGGGPKVRDNGLADFEKLKFLIVPEPGAMPMETWTNKKKSDEVAQMKRRACGRLAKKLRDLLAESDEECLGDVRGKLLRKLDGRLSGRNGK